MADNQKKKVYPITEKNESIMRRYPTRIGFASPGAAFEEVLFTDAIWDTGATHTCIDTELAKQLGLQEIGIPQSLGTAGGIATCYMHNVDIYLPNKTIVRNRTVLSIPNLGTGLVGADIISLGDFTISNFNGRTNVNFRMPSQSGIDFESWDRMSTCKKNRSRCLCGSGKKNKNCCGAN